MTTIEGKLLTGLFGTRAFQGVAFEAVDEVRGSKCSCGRAVFGSEMHLFRLEFDIVLER